MHDALPYLAVILFTALAMSYRSARQPLARAALEAVGDISEGTLSPEHARNIARWIRSWA